MKIKRVLCILLSFILLLSLFSASAFADGEEGGEAPAIIEEAAPENAPEGVPENVPEPEEEAPVLYTVTFDYCGQGDNFDYTVEAGGRIDIRPNDPAVPEGFIFDAWYIYYDDGSKAPWDFDNYSVDGNMVLYAEWKEKPTEPSEVVAPQPTPEPAAGTTTEEQKAPVSETPVNPAPTLITTQEPPYEPVADEINKPEETQEYPEFRDSRTVNGVLITVYAPEGVFPEGSTLDVRSIPNEKVEGVIEEQRPEDVNVAASYSFDIKVLDANGQPVEPAIEEEVRVSFRMAEVADENLEATVYHISEENQVQTVEELDVFTTDQTVEVSTDGFSIFVVEFINDEKKLEYNVTLGSSSTFPLIIKLSDILLTVDIIKYKEQISAVDEVLSSDQNVLTVGKDTDDWTITVNEGLTQIKEVTLSVHISGEISYRISVKYAEEREPNSLINGIPPADSLRVVYVGGIRWLIIGDGGNKWLVISEDKIKAGGLEVETVWSDAKLYGQKNIYANAFSQTEQKLVISTSKTDDPAYHYIDSTSHQGIQFSGEPLSENKLFLLSAEEVRTYCTAEADTCPTGWWVRSSIRDNGEVRYAGVVGVYATLGKGGLYHPYGPESYAVRPAFQLDLTPVFFESAAKAGKSSETRGNGKFGTFHPSDPKDEDAGFHYEAVKLTVTDASYNPVSASVSSTTVAPGSTIDLTYSGAGTGEKDYVSAIICEGDTIKYYASLKPASSGSGTWTMTMPDGLEMGKTYTLKVFSEQWNDEGGTIYTDVAGPVTEFPLEAKTNTYKVHFDKNATDAAGTMTDETFTLDKAQKLTKNAFTRTGYTFDGWNTEKAPTAAKPGTEYSDAQDVTNVTTTPDSTVTLYAQWKPITYTVKFDKNGENISGTMADQPFTYDAAQKLTKNAYTRRGYTFNGWNTEKVPTAAKPGKRYKDAQEVKNLTATDGASVTLYAQWKPITYTVRFSKNAQDATGTMADESFTYDKAKKLSKNTFTRAGYTFKGWNTLATPTSSNPGTSFKDLQEVKNLTSKDGETLTLYAQWTKNSPGGGGGGGVPRTDDPGNPGLWGMLIALSILAITGAAILIRKRSTR